VVGVASSGAPASNILLTGIAGMVAGALSMAAGEYVSVSSQADTEAADLERERQELATDPQGELDELTGIYMNRGLSKELAGQVAAALMAKDALGAHARDELGITETVAAQPLQAALSSALSFLAGAAAPVLLAAVTPAINAVAVISIGSLVCLFVLGVIGAQAGGASPWKAAIRVAFWGAVAMAVTAVIGKFAGAAL
jgi:VIT1/CCC1 family predicted Fe2+/Mn2+ transporter